jgi:hypothetical protein
MTEDCMLHCHPFQTNTGIVLSRVCNDYGRDLWLVTGFTGLLVQATRDYNSQTTVTHRLVPPITLFLLSMGMHGPSQVAIPLTAAPRFSTLTVKSKLSHDRRSVGQSILVSGTHLGLMANFSSLFSWNYLQTVAGLIIMGVLSDERTGL